MIVAVGRLVCLAAYREKTVGASLGAGGMEVASELWTEREANGFLSRFQRSFPVIAEGGIGIFLNIPVSDRVRVFSRIQVVSRTLHCQFALSRMIISACGGLFLFW